MSVSVACNKEANLASEVDKGTLPHSMKGYELYSWQEKGQWQFTLITGTNRNKGLEEIVSGENEVTEDGWIRIHTVGVDEIKNVLRRLPENEFVFWSEGQWVIEPTQPTDINLAYKTEEIVNEIKEHAKQCGLNFQGY